MSEPIKNRPVSAAPIRPAQVPKNGNANVGSPLQPQTSTSKPAVAQDRVELSAAARRGGHEPAKAERVEHQNALLANFAPQGLAPAEKAAGAAAPQAPAAPGGAPSSDFKYDGVPHVDHTSSIDWKPGSKAMSPTQANQGITEGYKSLNANMQRYLAGDPKGPKLPDLADWTTFGKYASREAGEQMRNLEDLSRFRANGDPAAARRLAENMTTPEAVRQGVGMGVGHGKDLAANVGNPIGFAKELSEAVGAPDDMMKALVKGNNGIYDNFAPAYDAFLRGEADGGKGMEALHKAGYTPGSDKDPQGFFNKSLGSYKQARELGLQAQQEKDPAKRQALLDQREKLVGQANLDLGNQEQMHIIQRKDIFGDPKVAANIKAIGGTMAMHDANGTHPLLPKGGDWSNFATRMGYKDVAPGTPGSQQIKDLDGKVHHYMVDPTAKGTISDYFNNNQTGARAANLNNSSPKPLFGPGMSDSQLAGQMTAALPRAAADLSNRAANEFNTQGALLQGQGAALINAGQATGGVPGLALQTLGTGEQYLGKGSQLIGQTGQQLSKGLEQTATATQVVVPQLLDNGAQTLRTTATAADLVGTGLQNSGNANIAAGQNRGGMAGTIQVVDGQIQKFAGGTIRDTVQLGRDTVATAKVLAPVALQQTVQTFNAVQNDLSRRVAPWNPRAQWILGIPNPFR